MYASRGQYCLWGFALRLHIHSACRQLFWTLARKGHLPSKPMRTVKGAALLDPSRIPKNNLITSHTGGNVLHSHITASSSKPLNLQILKLGPLKFPNTWVWNFGSMFRVASDWAKIYVESVSGAWMLHVLFFLLLSPWPFRSMRLKDPKAPAIIPLQTQVMPVKTRLALHPQRWALWKRARGKMHKVSSTLLPHYG